MLTIFLLITIKKYFLNILTLKNIIIQKTFYFQSIFGLIFLLLVLAPTSAFSQQHTYSVIKGNKKIGSLSVTRANEQNKIKYSIWSEARTGFILNIKINVLIEEWFEKGELVHSKFIRKVNGIEIINNEVEKFKDIYTLKQKGDYTKTLSSDIKYTTASMYFIEPVNMPFVYSENYQQLIQVIDFGKNKYLVEFPDGNRSYYTYRNGICTTVEAHTSWSVVFFKLAVPLFN